MSEIKNVGYTWMAECNQLTTLPFKGLTNKKDTKYTERHAVRLNTRIQLYNNISGKMVCPVGTQTMRADQLNLSRSKSKVKVKI